MPDPENNNTNARKEPSAGGLFCLFGKSENTAEKQHENYALSMKKRFMR